MRSGAWRVRASLEPAILASILGVAAILRFHALPQRGLIYWDEGKFALEGVRLESALHRLFAGGTAVAGKAVGTAKPTHALLIGLAYSVFGVHDYAALFLNATCSVLEVLLIYGIARELFGSRTALIAAAFLAVSEYDAIYARSALSESDANLMFLSGVLIWALRYSRRGRERRIKQGKKRHWVDKSAIYGSMRSPEGWGLGLAGLLMGVAFTANYRLIVYIAAVVGFDLVWIFLERGSRVTIRRIVAWGAGLIVAPLLWEVIDLVTRSQSLVLFRSEQTGAPRSYLSQVLYQLHQGRQSRINFNPGSYLHWYVLRSGWPMFLLLMAGILIAVWRGLGRGRSRHSGSGLGHGRPSYIGGEERTGGEVGTPFGWWAIVVPVVVPYVIYVFAPFIVARNLDAALPFAAVLSAAALVQGIDWIRVGLSLHGMAGSGASRRRVASRFGPAALLLLVAVGIGVLGARMSWRLGSERSGYARAASFVERYGNGKTLVSSEILVFYLRGNGAQCTGSRMPGTLTRLAADARAGYDYAALDHASGTTKVLVHKWMRPVAHYPTVGPLSVGENVLESEIDPQTHRPLQTVTVYRINTFDLPHIGRRPDVCNRERV